MSKKFTVRNEEFVCKVCGEKNFPAPKTCRDHCCKCLCSLHVDKYPGDRAESCQGVLRPLSVELARGEFASLNYKCDKCGALRKNKIAIDDDREMILKVFSGSEED